jgi:hypothetical protein
MLASNKKLTKVVMYEKTFKVVLFFEQEEHVYHNVPEKEALALEKKLLFYPADKGITFRQLSFNKMDLEIGYLIIPEN